jgi:hypothetical protein
LPFLNPSGANSCRVPFFRATCRDLSQTHACARVQSGNIRSSLVDVVSAYRLASSQRMQSPFAAVSRFKGLLLFQFAPATSVLSNSGYHLYVGRLSSF